MIAALKRFYRQNFCSISKTEFWELFEQISSPCRAILLDELSPLAGIRICYVWQEFTKETRLTIREVNFKEKMERIITDRKLSKEEFECVFRLIEEAGGVALGDFSGRVKDGVIYYLCWGNPSNPAYLSIKNPQAGSKQHQDFITMLKIKLCNY